MISGAHSSGIVAVATPAIAQEEAASAGGTAYFSFMLGCWAAPATSEQRDDVSSSVWPRLVVALLLPPHLQISGGTLDVFLSRPGRRHRRAIRPHICPMIFLARPAVQRF